MQHDEFKNMIEKINNYYEIDNLVEGCMLWYNVWKNRNTSQSNIKNINYISILD